MVLLAGFQLLLSRFTGQNDIRVGVPIANRHRAETQNLIGFFVNTQILRGVMDPRASLRQLIRQARETTLGAQAHQDLPFEQLVEALQPERSLNHNPLFQVMLNHQRSSDQILDQLPGLKLANYSLGDMTAQFELTLNTCEDANGGLSADFIYARELFEAGTIARMADHYLGLLSALVETPDAGINEIDLLGKTERTQLREWGVNSGIYADASPVHRLFEQQAQKRPDATALIFADAKLTYGELNARANQLAHYLIGLGVKPETRVGIAVERSIEMVVGLLAILKAGGAYVPLDPEYPQDRLAYMIEDSGVELLLLQNALRGKIPAPDSIITIELDSLKVANKPCHNPPVPVNGDNLIYVIYTSGSTGKPKGAANRHISVSSCMQWMQETYGLTDEDTVLHKAPFGFDVSAWELFWPLTTGARLAFAAPGDHRDPARIIELIRRHKITTLNFVPAMLQAFLAQEGIEHQTRLRHIICGGEAMPAATQEETLARLQGASLQNLYGPTEAAIHVTRWTCRADGKTRCRSGGRSPASRPGYWTRD
ncbi:MAG: AMP-binding protein [Cellvibrionaceae bacterium]|nr:AMP-binding protein [Cellvibrionaceae bacterium]